MKRTGPRFWMPVLLLSLLSAYLCAAAFIISLQLSLPRTDLAYGQSLRQAFSDPFVVSLATTGATVAGLVAFPIALFCFRDRNLVRCGLLVVGLTVAFLLLTATLLPSISLAGAPLVALAALLFCRFTRLPYFQPHEHTANVA